MKSLKFFLIVICCYRSVDAFAQSPKTIEADLSKSFDYIQNWNNTNFISPNSTDPDSLDVANNTLQRKFIYYAKKYPAIFSQVFKAFGGLSSDDGLLNIFSWDTYNGGTQHVFQTIILYRSGKNQRFLVDTISTTDNNTDAYDTLYTLKIDNKNYYIATYYRVLDLYARGEGVRIFSIENGKLNSGKIIKTRSGLTNKLHYEYNQTLTNADIMSETTLKYDSNDNVITFPVIDAYGHQTGGEIAYKFTGKYFEKVK